MAIFVRCIDNTLAADVLVVGVMHINGLGAAAWTSRFEPASNFRSRQNALLYREMSPGLP